MSQVKFSADPLVRIVLKGEHKEEFPVLPVDDSNLIGRFRDFLAGQNISPVGGSLSGDGVEVAFYSPEDAEKIIEWLRSQDVDEIPAR